MPESKEGTKKYLLVVIDVDSAPYLADWKAFKRFVRNIIRPSQPGMAQVTRRPQPGQRAGLCFVSSGEDLDTAYSLRKPLLKDNSSTTDRPF